MITVIEQSLSTVNMYGQDSEFLWSAVH